jgi:metal-responsive CopG/Arc/MetJ family transcriptional regulator
VYRLKKTAAQAVFARVGQTQMHVWLPDALIAEIENFWHTERLRSRTEALRVLLRIGLDKARPAAPSKGRSVRHN